jgi:hypothetical protein
MSINSRTASLVSGSLGVVLVALVSVPAVETIVRRLLAAKPSNPQEKELYEDEDGVATEESVHVFADKLPKLLIATLSVAGFVLSLVLAILNTVEFRRKSLFIENWLQVADWVSEHATERL